MTNNASAAAKGTLRIVKGTAFYFANQEVRIESDVIETPDGPSVLVRRWDATTQTVSGFRAYVLVADLLVPRCPRCNAPENNHLDTCAIILADLRQIADNPRNTDLYRRWARRELRSLMAANRRQAVAQ